MLDEGATIYLSTVGPTGRGDPGTVGTWVGTLCAFASFNDDCIDMSAGHLTSRTSTTDFVAVGRGGVIVSAPSPELAFALEAPGRTAVSSYWRR